MMDSLNVSETGGFRVLRETNGSLGITFGRTMNTHLQNPSDTVTLCVIKKGRQFVIYANGDTRISAIGFSNLMLKLGIVCSLGDQYGEATNMAYTLGPNDVALFVSYSGGLIDASAYSLERELDHRAQERL